MPTALLAEDEPLLRAQLGELLGCGVHLGGPGALCGALGGFRSGLLLTL